MNTQTKYNQIYSRIKEAKNILLLTHEKPDVDAVSSVCVFIELLENLNKKYFAYCYDSPPYQYNFLPHCEKIISDKNKLNFSDFDLIIVFDCGSIKRTKIEEEIKTRSANQFLIEIDHHIHPAPFSEIKYLSKKISSHPLTIEGEQQNAQKRCGVKMEDGADLELRDSEAAATALLVYEFFKANKIRINKNIANCVLAGILTDSGNFIYQTTSDKTIKISGEMLKLGANLPRIMDNTLRNKKLPALKIWGKAMARLQINKKYNIAFTILTADDTKDLDEEDLEGIPNFLGNMHDVKAIMVIREQADGRVKGSFRSAHPDTNVAKLAQALGGGGHIKASGFTVEGKLVKTESGGWKIV